MLLYFYFIFLFFGSHAWQCSRLTPNSVLRNHCWVCSVDNMGCQELNTADKYKTSALLQYYLFEPRDLFFRCLNWKFYLPQTTIGFSIHSCANMCGCHIYLSACFVLALYISSFGQRSVFFLSLWISFFIINWFFTSLVHSPNKHIVSNYCLLFPIFSFFCDFLIVHPSNQLSY